MGKIVPFKGPEITASRGFMGGILAANYANPSNKFRQLAQLAADLLLLGNYVQMQFAESVQFE